jgi:bifunctional non-homologous end joining protein LigD
MPAKSREKSSDGFFVGARDQARRLPIDGQAARERVISFTQRGANWTHKYPRIVAGALRLRADSFTMDGEAVWCGEDGVSNFDKLHSQAYNEEIILYAFDLLDFGEDDIRSLSYEERKLRLKNLVGRRRSGILFNEHLEGDGEVIFRHACRLGLEGIVSKRRDLPYRSGRTKGWVKVKNPKSPSIIRVIESGW